MEIEIIKIEVKEDSLDTTRYFGIFLKKVISTLHLVHWYANDYQVHKIIGKLYENLDELFDKLQEEIIGTSKIQNVVFPKFVPVIELDNIEKYKGETQTIIDTFNEINKLTQEILTSIEFNGYVSNVKSGINNTRDEILTSFNTASYLLSLINI